MNFLPQDLSMRPLKCAVVGYGETRKSDAILDVLENKIVCNPFRVLPNFPEGEGERLKPDISLLK